MVPCSRGLAGMPKEGSGAVLFMPPCSSRLVSSCRPASSYRVVIPAKAGIQAVLAPVLSARPVSSFRLLPPLPLAAGDRVRGLLSGRGCVLPSPRPSPRGRGSRRASRTSPWSRVVGALRECRRRGAERCCSCRPVHPARVVHTVPCRHTASSFLRKQESRLPGCRRRRGILAGKRRHSCGSSVVIPAKAGIQAAGLPATPGEPGWQASSFVRIKRRHSCESRNPGCRAAGDTGGAWMASVVIPAKARTQGIPAPMR